MKDNKHMWKTVISKLMITFMVIMSVMVISPVFADAATQPTLTKTTRNILVGKQYNLNINNKVKKSTYVWSTSNKKIATVNSKGIVTGVSQGAATITCKIKTPVKTYRLTCKVTIIKPAKLFSIKNKITALNLGQKYNLDRTLTPSTSNDKTTWTSSDVKIASPDKKGKFTALKTGTVTITGTTLSGAKDSVTIKVVDKDGTVTNQSQLDALLGSGASLITIKTTDAVNFVIAAGDYSKQKLVVDAPNSDVTNNGKFASIEIKQIKSNTWYENAVGNLLKILASDSRIVISPNAKVSIEVNEKGATLKIENNGVVEDLYVIQEADIAISGDSDEDIPVVINVPNIKITTSVPLNLECKAKMELVLLKGAEATKVQAATESVIPTITGNVTVKVTVGSGTTATVKEVVGTPIPETPTGGTGGNGGNTGGNGGNTGGNGGTTFTFDKAITDVTAVSFVYSGVTHTINSELLSTVKALLTDGFTTSFWNALPTLNLTFGSQTVNISGAGSTKTLTITGGQFNGKSYSVTYSTNSVTIKNANDVSITFTKSLDETTFVITVSTDLILSSAQTAQTASGIYANLTSISVTYATKTYTVDCPAFATLQSLVNSDTTLSQNWTAITSDTKLFDGQHVTIAATAASNTKTVTFIDGQSVGKAFTVTVNSANSVAITSVSDNVTATITKGTNNITVVLN
ncbi:MAG: Ig-like domain-containing protein [Herbinix sp.]|nr:Ig-like domain-containing protein [Herbinix sp.]